MLNNLFFYRDRVYCQYVSVSLRFVRRCLLELRYADIPEQEVGVVKRKVPKKSGMSSLLWPLLLGRVKGCLWSPAGIHSAVDFFRGSSQHFALRTERFGQSDSCCYVDFLTWNNIFNKMSFSWSKADLVYDMFGCAAMAQQECRKNSSLPQVTHPIHVLIKLERLGTNWSAQNNQKATDGQQHVWCLKISKWSHLKSWKRWMWLQLSVALLIGKKFQLFKNTNDKYTTASISI